MGTCALVGADPLAYFTDVRSVLETRRFPASRIDELLPPNWIESAAASARAPVALNRTDNKHPGATPLDVLPSCARQRLSAARLRDLGRAGQVGFTGALRCEPCAKMDEALGVGGFQAMRATARSQHASCAAGMVRLGGKVRALGAAQETNDAGV